MCANHGPRCWCTPVNRGVCPELLPFECCLQQQSALTWGWSQPWLELLWLCHDQSTINSSLFQIWTLLTSERWCSSLLVTFPKTVGTQQQGMVTFSKFARSLFQPLQTGCSSLMAGSSSLYQSFLSHARPVFTWLWFWLRWLASFTQPHTATMTTWWNSLTSPPRAWNNNNKQLIKASWEKVGDLHLLSSWIHIQNTGSMLHFKKLLNVQQICYKGQTRGPRKTKERGRAETNRTAGRWTQH